MDPFQTQPNAWPKTDPEALRLPLAEDDIFSQASFILTLEHFQGAICRRGNLHKGVKYKFHQCNSSNNYNKQLKVLEGDDIM